MRNPVYPAIIFFASFNSPYNFRCKLFFSCHNNRGIGLERTIGPTCMTIYTSSRYSTVPRWIFDLYIFYFPHLKILTPVSQQYQKWKEHISDKLEFFFTNQSLEIWNRTSGSSEKRTNEIINNNIDWCLFCHLVMFKSIIRSLSCTIIFKNTFMFHEFR